MNIRKTIAALAISAASIGGVTAGTTKVAHAHSFGAQGPAHTHIGTCNASGTIFPQTVTNQTCVRALLSNGAWLQESYLNMVGQGGFVILWCSYKTSAGYMPNTIPYGPYGYTFEISLCQNPKYGNPPIAWSVRP
jgi:hypothetical protein